MRKHIQEVLWLTSTDRQKLFYVSLAFERIWGHPVKSLCSYPGGYLKFLTDSIHPQDREEVVANFSQKPDHESQQEYRILRPDGSIRWLRSHSFVIPNPWGEESGASGHPEFLFATVSEDITSCKQTELELQNARDRFEQRITARTAELIQANTRLQEEIAERQLLTEKLQAQKDFLQTIIDTNPNLIYVKNREGKYVLANQVFAERCGLTLTEVIGKTTAQLHPNQEDAERLMAEDREVFAKLQPKFIPEEIRCTPTGEVRYYQTVKTPLLAADGQVHQILGVSTDISDVYDELRLRKLTEKQLRQSEVRLRLALDAARMGNWEWNLQTGMIAWSPRLEQLYCLSANTAEISYETFLAIVHPEDRALVEQATKGAIATGEDCDIEYRIIWPDQSIRWIQSKGQVIYDETGKPLQTIGINLDITQQKLAEEQLRQREEQLRLALESAHMGFWERNLETEKITCSHHLKQLYGLTPHTSELTYKSFLAMVHPEDRNRLYQVDQQAIEMRKKCDVEFRIIRPDGTIRWMESKGQIVYQEEDVPVRMAGINLDITERKQAEIQIQASLREKEVLLQEIHHRVKNNLQVITSLLDLQSQHIDEPAVLELFQESQNRVKSMALVHEKLYQSQDFASINFIEYIESLTSYLFQVYAVKAGPIALELDIARVNLTIDTAIPCGLIISELVSNALKYAFPDRREGTIKVALQSDDYEHYRIIVRDNGVGLPKNFNFKTSKSLGLQLVNVLTEQLDGLLEIDCQYGTEFKICFPEISC